MSELALTPFEIGEVVAERYRIVRLLGEGGMAVVYEGEHLRLRQAVAVKVLRAELRGHPDVVARFEREGRAIGKLRSRHIVRVFDVDTTAKGIPFLVMELLDGGSLEDELAKRGALPVGEAVEYVLQACAAVAEAHDHGVIHRDLKPSNLLLANEGGARVLKVLDFGISKDPGDDAKLTKTETVMGTPLYMAPEQFRSAKDVDERADVWALGATLYELLAGRPPFVGASTSVAVSIVLDPMPELATFRAGLPAGLERAIHRALAKDRKDRFPSVRELAAAIAPFSGELPSPSLISRASASAHPTAHTELLSTPLPQLAAPNADHVTLVRPEGVQARTVESTSSPAQPAGFSRGRIPRGSWIAAGLLAVTASGAAGWYALRPGAASDKPGPAVEHVPGTPAVGLVAPIAPEHRVVEPAASALSTAGSIAPTPMAPMASAALVRTGPGAPRPTPSSKPVITSPPHTPPSTAPKTPPIFFPESH